MSPSKVNGSVSQSTSGALRPKVPESTATKVPKGLLAPIGTHSSHVAIVRPSTLCRRLGGRDSVVLSRSKSCLNKTGNQRVVVYTIIYKRVLNAGSSNGVEMVNDYTTNDLLKNTFPVLGCLTMLQLENA